MKRATKSSLKRLVTLCLSAALTLSLSVSAAAANPPLPTVPKGYTITKVQGAVDTYGTHYFHDGLMPLFKVASVDEEGMPSYGWTYLSTDGTIKSFKHSSGFEFSEGLAPVLDPESMTLGYIDTTGKLVLPCQYRSYDHHGIVNAGRFINGNALIYLRSGNESPFPLPVWGQIDRSGKEVPLTLDPDKQDNIYSDTHGNATGVIHNKTLLINGKEHHVDFSEGYGLVNLFDYTTVPESAVRTIAEYQEHYIVKEDSASATAPLGELAQGRSTAVTFNNAAMELPMYAILGHNYIKLRDFAKLVNGTPRQFSVGYDGTKNAISLQGGNPYVAIGDELTPLGNVETRGALNPCPISHDGSSVTLTPYAINGYNYFQLRDLCSLF
ncbi:MAG: WG repeat-containing protein, partial [Oscillospiraceae bacterium]